MGQRMSYLGQARVSRFITFVVSIHEQGGQISGGRVISGASCAVSLDMLMSAQNGHFRCQVRNPHIPVLNWQVGVKLGALFYAILFKTDTYNLYRLVLTGPRNLLPFRTGLLYLIGCS